MVHQRVVVFFFNYTVVEMQITNDDLFLDFETRSKADLKKVGAWRYAEDPSTQPLCLAYALGESEPKIWLEGQRQPKDLIEYFESGKRVHGWNALSFERAMFEVVMKPRYGWIVPALEDYHDTMCDALALALPGKLETCCIAIGTQEKKDPIGAALIRKFSKPISAGKKKGLFREREDFVREFVQFYEYCKQDVRSERDVYRRLPFAVTGKERDIMLLIARINERGVFIDDVARKAIDRAIDEETDSLCSTFEQLTGVRSPLQREKYLDWLRANGAKITNTQKETIRDLLETDKKDKKLSREVKLSFALAAAITKTSNAKYKAIGASMCKDGTVKNNFIYHKANTGRLAGAGFQLQNLPADTEKYPELMVDCFVDGDKWFIRLWGGVLQVASGLIRSMIVSRTGNKFLNGDLKGVEMRGSAWAAREWDVLEQLGKGVDPYKITAAKMYAKKIEGITKEERQAGKICVLAGGFGGAHNAILNMARKMGLHILEEEAIKHIADFRKARKKLVNAWYAFGNAAVAAVESPGEYFYPTTKEDGEDKRFKFVSAGNFLYMVLPCGRKLSFPYPKIHEEYFKGFWRKSVTAMWVNIKTNQWEKRFISGPSFFQSAVQALCRDLLMESHLRTEEAGYPLMLSVHDEQQSEVPDDERYTVAEYGRLMCVVPDWAKGFPIAADCWEGYRFKK